MKIDTQELQALAAPEQARFDLYAFIHKALRLRMAQTLTALGSTDPQDDAAFAQSLAQVEALAEFCRQHVEHEDSFVHPALVARCAGACDQAAADHVSHRGQIAALVASTRETAAQSGAARGPALQALYLALSVFIADNFEHMHREETRHNAALWAAYSDAELLQIHDRIVGSLPPEEASDVMRWMVPALAPQERTAVLDGMRATAPEPAFAGLLAMLRPHLEDSAWSVLTRSLGLQPAPAPVA